MNTDRQETERQRGDIRLLFCGDVVGRAGRDAILTYLPLLKKGRDIDVVVVSGDNAASGFGVTPAICKDFFNCGVDVITGGDHVWDQKETHSYLEQEPRLLRPHNFPDKTPGKGWYIHTMPNGQKVGVLHLLGQVFHKEHVDCPFAKAEQTLASYKLKHQLDAILVDMHAEATSEKNAMGVFLDSKVSAVVGSHTHVPTADARILKGGTAYQTDTGMCGDYENTVIGFQPDIPLQLFTMKFKKVRMQTAMNSSTLCATLIHISGTNGLARSIEPIMLGGAIGNKV